MWCSNCGTLLPDDARFCLICGAPQATRDGDDAVAPAVASIADYDSAVCETSLWRGYVKAEFVATAHDGDAAYEVARSPAFRCRGGGPAEDDARAVAAFEALLDRLASEGWEPVAGGRPWYVYRFRRRTQDVVGLLSAPPIPSRSRASDVEGTAS